MIMVTC